jgi:hypothetical protein
MISERRPPIADMDQHGRDGRFVPKADIHLVNRGK